MGVQEAVLGLVVNESRYGYLIARELEHEHGRTAVYETLTRLLDLRLIEPVEMPETGRPRKWYRATAKGQALHAKLVAKALQERDDLLDRLRGASPDTFVPILDEYEALLHRQIQSDPGSGDDFIGWALARERELVNGARLEWLAHVREKIADGFSTA